MSNSVRELDIAIAHKDNVVDGGGERLCRQLGEAFDAPIYSGHVPDDRDTDMVDIFGDHGLAKRAISRGGVTRQLAYMLMWRRHADDLREYDVVITSGNEPLWYTPEEEQTMVAYVHHTLRRQHDRVAEVDSWLETVYGMGVQVLFDHNIRKPDLYVCNSELVAHRLTHYFGVPEGRIRVVYPGVPVTEFGPDRAETGDYYFACSRLVDHKRFDELVRAFADLDERLVIAGKGDAREHLEAMATDNVEFLGYVSENEKRRRLAEAKAFCFGATQEDFGIAPAEALASGTPLITVSEGFPAKMVTEGKSGLTYDRGAENLQAAIRRFESAGVEWTAQQIAAFADRFSMDRFNQEIREAVSEARERTEVDPEWDIAEIERQPLRADGGDE